MHKKINKRTAPPKSATTGPNRKFIKSAVEDYLEQGGKITKLETDTSYYSAMFYQGPFPETDDDHTEINNRNN